MTDLRIEALDFSRRVTAALEQYAAQQQVDLHAELDRVRAQLHREQNETTWAAAYIVGDPVPPRVPGKTCSLIESVAIEVRKQLTEARAELDKTRLSLEHAMEAARFAKSTLRGVPVGRVAGAGATLSLLESAAIEARKEIEDLRGANRAKDKEIEAGACKSEYLADKIAQLEQTIEGRAAVIKSLHAEYHELEARKMATQYDLDRAKEEIAFAEAEIAKYKPLVEAVRVGAVFAWKGQWVQLRGFETEQTTGDSLELITVTGNYYAGVIQCL